MTEQHPITPPAELVNQWRNDAPNARDAGATCEAWIATQAARWGADHELKACCDAIYEYEDSPLSGGTAELLRALRRPKPPSLKEQALKALDLVDQCAVTDMRHLYIHTELAESVRTIYRALKQLND